LLLPGRPEEDARLHRSPRLLLRGAWGESIPDPAARATAAASVRLIRPILRRARARRYGTGVPQASLATAIAAVAEADPVMAGLIEAVGPIRHRPRTPDGHFGALVRSIVFQQLAGPAASAIHQRMRALVPGPLTPETLLAVPDDALRGAGLSANKVAALRDLSTTVLGGTRALGGR